MSPDAYAGFLRLLLTPDDETPEITPEVAEYLRYLAAREALPPRLRRLVRHWRDKAA